MFRILPLAVIASLGCGAASPSAREIALTSGSTAISGGITLGHVEIGDPAGEPVLFLHGYTDTRRSFLATMRALHTLRPDLRLIALDQRGHGASSMPDSASCAPAPEQCFHPANFAADVIAFMDRLEIRRVHLVGASMGSLVAQEVALSQPSRVDRLVLIGSAAGTAGHPAVKDFLLAGLTEGPWREQLERRGIEFPAGAYHRVPTDADTGAVRWMLANFVVEPLADSTLLGVLVRETVRVPMGTWLGVPRALVRYDNAERLASLTAPTLVIWGSQDNIFPTADQERLRLALDRAAAACGAGYVWKPYGRSPLDPSGQPTNDLAHNLQWAAPEAVAADIAGFLKDGGMPTSDLTYGERGALRTAPGEAQLVVRRLPDSCSSL
jgi:pimeloyl-ACP methyl ester carboxylesterase